MTNPIPYTQSAFNKILNNSRVFHNNQEVNPVNMNFNITGTNADGMSFIQSFIAELDLFISSNMYDVEIRDKVKKYLEVQMLKWGKFFKKDMIKAFQDIDMKYVHIFKQRDYIQSLIVPYLYDNVMITD